MKTKVFSTFENIIIEQIPVGDYQVNTYLVVCTKTKEGVLIDPAGEEQRLAFFVRKAGVKLKYILNTHGHADHVVANQKLKQIFSVPACMHEADDAFFSDSNVRKITTKELGLLPPEPAEKLSHCLPRLKYGPAITMVIPPHPLLLERLKKILILRIFCL